MNIDSRYSFFGTFSTMFYTFNTEHKKALRALQSFVISVHQIELEVQNLDHTCFLVGDYSIDALENFVGRCSGDGLLWFHGVDYRATGKFPFHIT